MQILVRNFKNMTTLVKILTDESQKLTAALWKVIEFRILDSRPDTNLEIPDSTNVDLLKVYFL